MYGTAVFTLRGGIRPGAAGTGRLARCLTGAAMLVLGLCGAAWCGAPPLAACPESPNCVSSLSAGGARFIEPLTYSGPTVEARERLLAVLRGMERMEVRSTGERHVHAISFSRIWRFVDDVEFYFDPDGRTIHCRSASRTGYWDLGVNRRRIEAIRALFAAEPP